MLFVTNRSPRQSYRTKLNRKIDFSLQNTSASQCLFFCERRAKHDYIEIGSRSFFDRLKSSEAFEQILLYIHGFNNTNEKEIFPRAQRLQELIDKEGAKSLVQVIPLIWPCDDDAPTAIIDDYWDDQRAADQSGNAFARLLGKFDDWRHDKVQKTEPCTKRINVLAHSMGARVLRNALHTWAHHDAKRGVPQLFRNVFLVAADVVNHTLEAGEEGRFIPDSARNVVVYFSNEDLAMPASKIANLKNFTVSRRLGMTGPENLDAVPRNVYEVDCDNIVYEFDKLKGHSYFLCDSNDNPSPVLLHMIKAITDGRVEPADRHFELPKP